MKELRLITLALYIAAWPARAEDLLQLYHQAVAGNPTLKARELAVERATARKDQVRSRLLPQLTASATRARNDFELESTGRETFYPSTRKVIQAKQPLLDLASVFGTRAEQAKIRQSEEELAAARMEIAGELVDRYLDVLGADDQLVYLAAEKTATAVQRNRLQRLLERQMAKITDVYEAEARYTALEAQEIEIRNVRDVALERLREITGVEVKDVAALAREDFPAIAGDMPDWVERGVRNNRELLGLQHAIEAEENGIAGAKAQHVPQISLVATKSWADVDFDNRRNPPYSVGTVGVQLSLPIFEGGRVNALVRESEARRDIARQQYEEKRREVERLIRAAYLKTVSDRARIDATALSVRSQEKAVEAQARGVELGTSTVVDLLDARRRLYQARSEHSRARLELISSLTTLRIQSGALTEADIEEMNGWFANRKDRYKQTRLFERAGRHVRAGGE